MSNLVDLTKRVSVILEKRQVPDIKVQVGFAIDVSGSMQGMFNSGVMQTVVNRMQAIANKFDDNQTLDMWMFHNKGFELESAVPSMFGSYVQEHILNQSDLWGGTDFAPVLGLIEEHYFGAVAKTKALAQGAMNKIGGFFGKKAVSASTPPVYLIFLTDGDNSDESKAAALMDEMASKNMYIQFVGVGRGSSFRFIKRMAERHPHVGFVDFSDPGMVSDDQMFEALLSDEFINWVKQ